LADVLASQAERSRGFANVYERASALSERFDRIAEGAGEQDVRWYELFPRGFALHATPLDLAAPLRGLRELTQAAWIHTSATLSVAGDFGHFARQLGLDDPQTLSLESPFDYPEQALCYLPPGLPDPAARDYTERVIDAVMPVLEASRGRAFLLFTSHRALRRAADLLRERVPWPLFVQGDAPRHRLLEEFRASGHGVLLGAASFWEGVDVQGEALSVVVIDKLPFAPPDDPVLSARLDALTKKGLSPFAVHQLPQAVITLKQGAGRLIRAETDRGVLMICDTRLVEKPYGRRIWQSLPPFKRTREIEVVREFFEENAAPAQQAD